MHLEKVDKDEGRVLMDFRNEYEYELFLRLANSESLAEKKSASMVAVDGVLTKGLREDGQYEISGRTIRAWVGDDLIQEVDDSLVVGYQVRQRKRGRNRYRFNVARERGIRKRDGDPPAESVGLSITKPSGFARVEVYVHDVGQGNWNEVRVDRKAVVVYDLGAAWPMRAAGVRMLVAPADQRYQQEQPSLIVSHWDVDHYQGLIGLSDAAIQSFTRIVLRSTAPNRTSSQVLNRLRALNPSALVSLNAEPRGTIASQLVLKQNLGWLKVYNARMSSSRNKSGIALTVESNTATAVLPADHHYLQITRDLLPQLPSKKRHHLVIPHHGGRAGRMTYTAGTRPLGIAVLSADPNRYPHLVQRNSAGLTNAGFSILATTQGPVTVPLP